MFLSWDLLKDRITKCLSDYLEQRCLKFVKVDFSLIGTEQHLQKILRFLILPKIINRKIENPVAPNE